MHVQEGPFPAGSSGNPKGVIRRRAEVLASKTIEAARAMSEKPAEVNGSRAHIMHVESAFDRARVRPKKVVAQSGTVGGSAFLVKEEHPS